MSQIQALDRIAPCLPVPPTTPARMAHSAIAQHYRRHPHQVFVRFPRLIDATVPAGLDLQLTCDNYATYKTPAVKNWLLRHPRFHLHFAPASSRWIKPGTVVRRAHQPQAPPIRPSPRDRARIRHPRLDEGMEHQPQVLRVDQGRRPDPRHPRRLLQANQRLRALERGETASGA